MIKKLNKKALLTLKFGFIIFLLSLTGCTQEADEAQVLPLAEAFFTTIKEKNFEQSLTFYTQDFFNLKSKAQWLDYLKDVNAKLGNLEGIKIRRQQVNTIFSGRRFIFEFSNRYTNGLATETVIFFQKVGDEKIKIQMHKIVSKKLPGNQH